MKINNVLIEDTFCEAWELEAVRVLFTGLTEPLAYGAAIHAAGAGGSCELGARVQAGIEGYVPPRLSPDGRPGYKVIFTFPPNPPYGRDKMVSEIALRLLLSTMIPNASAFDIMPKEYCISKSSISDVVVKKLRKLGQTYIDEIHRNGKTLYRIPNTSGDYFLEKSFGIASGSDGHFIIHGTSAASAVLAAEAAKDALFGIFGASPVAYGPEAVAKRPQYCPTLKDKVQDTKVGPNVNSVITVLMCGIGEKEIKEALRNGMRAAVQIQDLVKITAMNFGGKFGKYKFGLHDLLKE